MQKKINYSENAHQYDLFKLRKLLCVSGKAQKSVKSTEEGENREESLNSSVRIRIITQGGYKGHEFFGIYTTNNYLIFRYVGEGGVPLVKQLPWFVESSKSIAAMCFNPTAQWLLVVTSDLSLALLPIYFFMCKASTSHSQQSSSSSSGLFTSVRSWEATSNWLNQKSNQTPSLLSYTQNKSKASSLTNVSDITLINKHSRKTNANVTCCLWWKTPKGKDVAIVSNVNGEIILIDLGKQKEYLVNIGKMVAINNIELLSTSTSIYLLISTLQNGHYQLLLAHQVQLNKNENFTWKSILSFKSLLANPTLEVKKGGEKEKPVPPHFQPKSLSSHFQNNLKVSVQKPEKNGEIKELIGVYNPSNNKFEVFDGNLNFSKFALYAYQLFPGIKMLLLTDKLMFSLDKENTISVISNLFSGTSSSSLSFATKQKANALMQQFQVSKEQTIMGMLRNFPSSGNYSGSSHHFSNTHDHSHHIEGFYFYSGDTLYECRPKKRAEDIFIKLVGEGLETEEAEPFGKTLSLDLFRLYEDIADKYFSKGLYGRALSLYFLSNVKTSKLVNKYVEIGRVDVVANHLMTSLRESSLLSNEERKELSFILFQFYLEKVFCKKMEEIGFLQFLKSNKDYDIGKAMIELIKNGCIEYYLNVAHSRNLMPLAINTLINKGSLLLTNKELLFLFSNQQCGYVEYLKSSGNSTLMRCLPIEEQIELIVRDQAHLLNDKKALMLDCQLLPPLLPFLDSVKLRKVLGWLRPKLLSSSPSSLPSPQKILEKKHPNKNSLILPIYNSVVPLHSNSDSLFHFHLVELYLFILLKLLFLPSPLQQTSLPFLPSSSLPSSPLPPNSSTQQQDIPLSDNPPSQQSLVTDSPVNPPLRESTEAISNPAPENVEESKEEGKEEVKEEAGDLEKEEVSSQDPLNKEKPRKTHTKTKSSILSSLSTKIRASKVAAGWHHAAIISSDAQLYTFGSDRKGQLGLSEGKLAPSFSHKEQPKERYELTPTRVPFFSQTKMVEVACGGEFSFAVDSEGKCYSWGSNSNGQTLHHSQLSHYTTPQHLPLNEKAKVKKVSLGDFHTFILLEDSTIYCGGLGDSGQLGLGVLQNPEVKTPRKLSIPGHTIISISCGSVVSLFLTLMGSVLVCGQSGTGNTGKNESNFVPQLVKDTSLLGKRVIDVSGGDCHCHVVTDLGSIYYWSILEAIPKPQLLEELAGFKILKVSGGHWMNTALAENSNTLFMWSSRKSESKSISKIKIEADTPLREFAVGEEFFVACTESGDLYSYGSNQHGATGVGLCEGSLKIATKITFTTELTEKFAHETTSAPPPSLLSPSILTPSQLTPPSSPLHPTSSSQLQDIKATTQLSPNISFSHPPKPLQTSSHSSPLPPHLLHSSQGKSLPQPLLSPNSLPSNSLIDQSLLSPSNSVNNREGEGKKAEQGDLSLYQRNFEEKELEKFLTSNEGFRSFKILQYCFHFQNWQAASFIYTKLGKHKLSLLSLLKHISQHSLSLSSSSQPSSSQSQQEEKESIKESSKESGKEYMERECLQCLSNLLNLPLPNKKKVALLKMLLKFWKKHELSLPLFQQHALHQDTLPLLSPLLHKLFKLRHSKYSSSNIQNLPNKQPKTTQNTGEKIEVLILPFTPTFMMEMIREGNTLKKKKIEKKKTNVSKQRLWEGIKTNLAKDVSEKAHNKIQLSSLSAFPPSSSNKPPPNTSSFSKAHLNPSFSAPPKGSEKAKTYLFTCQHSYDGEQFSSLLSQLKQKLESNAIPLSLQILFQEYKQSSFINLSCPLCLFNNYLRKHLHHSSSLSHWETN